MNTIPIDHVGCNVYQTDRFNINYKLNHGEQIYALFCTYILTLGGLFGLIRWMLEVATN
ncbi:hypothetical protein GQ597_01895 [Gilliamella sp. Pra-s65]|uniref:hypothetical protein n=1 Tax=unclassified Gilliamella TaxID=2685620 RepID=UPI00136605E0|nr:MULTISPECIES: hypothetical protein [unclassified Gilliamella]MWN89466.1 hypothetical protein [Gilliamella sp. Pra-s65]MWP72782.1 hypothetical protein [Gilliamella sp. Pra-s52]